jgi:hypothetical protein
VTHFDVVEAPRGFGVKMVNGPTVSFSTGPRSWAARSIIHSSGMISPTSLPWQKSRTTELSETTMHTALVTALMLAVAICLLPSPRGTSTSDANASRDVAADGNGVCDAKQRCLEYGSTRRKPGWRVHTPQPRLHARHPTNLRRESEYSLKLG